MDRNTTEKGTYRPHEGKQQQQGSSSGKDKKEEAKQTALYESCCRDFEVAYDKVHHDLCDNVKEFTSLWKYYSQNELMPRQLYNFYNAVTTNRHELMLLEKSLSKLQELEERIETTRLGPKPVESGVRTYVDWASKMPENEPGVNWRWSVW
jgi:hypothetical protein